MQAGYLTRASARVMQRLQRAAKPLSPPPAIGRLQIFRQLAETLAFGAAGGLTLGLAGMPAGYLSGAIIAVAIAALAGRPMTIPPTFMRVLLVLLGTSLGAVVTPETLHGMATYPVSISVLIVACVVISIAGTAYLRVVHGWDTITAYLATAPGGLSQVMAIAIEIDADVRAIAIVQTIRVVIIAVCLPALMSLAGITSGHVARSLGGAFDPSQIGELGILLAVSTAAAYAAHLTRFPGGMLFGAMIASAALHGSGYIHVVMPWWVAYSVMIAFGSVTGSRFANTPMRLLLHYVGAAFGSFATAVAIVAVFAFILVEILGVPMAEVLIAYAPGAVDAMMLLALALNLNPVYVGAHHLTRIFFVLLTMPIIARMSARRKMHHAHHKKKLPIEQPLDDE
jgi:membrane AbrB-like protein